MIGFGHITPFVILAGLKETPEKQHTNLKCKIIVTETERNLV